jgi:hypothetical protein
VSPDHPGPDEPDRPPKPPHSGGKRTRAVLVLVGALVLVVVVVAILALSGQGTDGGKDGDGGQRGVVAAELTTPQTVAGEYRREGKGFVQRSDRVFVGGAPKSGGNGKSSSSGKHGKDKGGEKVPGMVTEGVASATYESPAHRTLALNGAYGRLSDPRKSVDWMLARTGRNLARIDAEPKGHAKAFSPSGFDGETLKCRRYVVRSTVKTSSLTNCVWGDSGTLGSVLVARLTSTKHDPAVPMDEAAALTAKVRTDSRVKAG